MNAKTSSSEDQVNQKAPSAGIRRIRRISRYLKAMVLLYFVAAPLYCIASYFFYPGSKLEIHHFAGGSSSSLSVGEILLMVLEIALYFAIAVTFYRLLNLFEKGTFFSSANVRLLRWLGYLAFSIGLLGVLSPVLLTGLLTFPIILLAAVGSPWVAGGLFVIMLSHIMDEGCKMREEQDLTV